MTEQKEHMKVDKAAVDAALQEICMPFFELYEATCVRLEVHVRKDPLCVKTNVTFY
jgi:hypothetical protein